MKSAFGLVKETFQDWSQDKASRLAASLAYFTMFSIAPFLLIIIAIVGLVLGNRENVQNQVLTQVQGLVGQQGADLIKTMIQNASKPSSSIIATVIGVVTLLLGAAGVFGALQDSLNTIWGVAPNPKAGIMGMLKDRFVSFSMVLGVGFLLLVSLVLSAALAALGTFVGGLFPGAQILAQVVNFVISFVVITLLFALMYKYLPDVKIAWSDVWIGAAVTSLLFSIGRFLIGLYLGRAAPGSTYGAAGSLVVLLVWIYYSAMILFMGAEFTKVYAYKYGSRIEPEETAVPVTEEARAEQGIPTKQRVEEGARAKGQAGKAQPAAASATGKASSGQSAAPHGAGTKDKGAAVPDMQPVPLNRDKAKPRGRGLAPYALGVGVFMLSMVAFAVRNPKK